MKHPTLNSLLSLVIFAGLLAACNGGTPASPSAIPGTPLATAALPTLIPTDTPALPTATPVPLAATVNGEPLTLAEFQAELRLFEAAQAESGTNLATEQAQTQVLDTLIDAVLLAQAARETGFLADEASVQTRMDELSAALGGAQALADWMAAHGYDEADFRQALRREMEAAWMRDQIAAAVGETADQAHARQILLYNSVEAEQVLALLQGGQDFSALAASYDPVNGGDLGWFPRGTLLSSEVEEAVFSLEPGQYSAVIESALGFHIVQLVERDAQHPLSPEARQMLRQQAVQDWLTGQRQQSSIVVLLP